MSDKAEEQVESLLMSTQQAADYLGYSKASIRASRYTGILSGVDAPISCKIGSKSIRYLKSDLDAWAAKNVKPRH